MWLLSGYISHPIIGRTRWKEPQAGEAYADWIYKHGTGIVMRRNDWSYTCYVDIEGYNKVLVPDFA